MGERAGGETRGRSGSQRPGLKGRQTFVLGCQGQGTRWGGRGESESRDGGSAGSAGSRELVNSEAPGSGWGLLWGASSHLRDVIPGRHTGFPSCSKVAENPEGIAGTALVGVHPVLSCPGTRRRGSGPEVPAPRGSFPTSLPLLPPAVPADSQPPCPPFLEAQPGPLLFPSSSPTPPSSPLPPIISFPPSLMPLPQQHPRLPMEGGRSADTLVLEQGVVVGLHTCPCVSTQACVYVSVCLSVPVDRADKELISLLGPTTSVAKY